MAEPNLPAVLDPLTPPDCDCRGLPFMPLEVVRLRESDLAALATGDEFKAAVLLWCAAWTQVPASSLPDDDRILARLAGYSLAEWRELREMALRGWLKCSDGRLYHPLIADHAAAAFAKRRGQKAKADSRWARSKSHGTQTSMPQHEPDDATAYAPVMQGTGTGTEEREDADASLSLVSDDDQPVEKKYPSDFEACWKAYPHAKGRSSKSKSLGAWRRLSTARRKALPSAIARYASEGREPKAECGAPAMERWLARDLDLNWHDPAPANPAAAPSWQGPADFRAAVVKATDEDFARGWLDRCAYRNGPENVIVSDNSFVIDRLRRDVGHVLESFGIRAIVEARR